MTDLIRKAVMSSKEAIVLTKPPATQGLINDSECPLQTQLYPPNLHPNPAAFLREEQLNDLSCDAAENT